MNRTYDGPRDAAHGEHEPHDEAYLHTEVEGAIPTVKETLTVATPEPRRKVVDAETSLARVVGKLEYSVDDAKVAVSCGESEAAKRYLTAAQECIAELRARLEGR